MSTRREFLTQAAVSATVATASIQLAEAAVRDTGVGTNQSTVTRTPLKTYRIPHTDLTVTRLAFGCAMIGMDWNAPDFVAKTVPVINAAHEQGITYFDTADVYGNGNAEVALGEVLRQRPGLRRRIVIQSKCGDRIDEGGVVDNSRERIVSSVEGSLKRLGTDHLDVLLLHWPDSLVEPDEVASAFDQLKRSGKVRHFGVSNHSPLQIELLKKSVREPLVINQIQLGLAHWYGIQNVYKEYLIHTQEGVATVDYCRVHEMQVQAYSPLKSGSMGKPPSLLNVAPDASPQVQKAAQMLADLGKKYAVSPAAIMLAWLLRHPARIVGIIGSTKPEHITDNVTADRVELSREEWYSLLRTVLATQAPQHA